jgi:hypothetical protein
MIKYVIPLEENPQNLIYNNEKFKIFVVEMENIDYQKGQNILPELKI